jgi:hypothetical protein
LGSGCNIELGLLSWGIKAAFPVAVWQIKAAGNSYPFIVVFKPRNAGFNICSDMIVMLQVFIPVYFAVVTQAGFGKPANNYRFTQ